MYNLLFARLLKNTSAVTLAAFALEICKVSATACNASLEIPRPGKGGRIKIIVRSKLINAMLGESRRTSLNKYRTLINTLPQRYLRKVHRISPPIFRTISCKFCALCQSHRASNCRLCFQHIQSPHNSLDNNPPLSGNRPYNRLVNF